MDNCMAFFRELGSALGIPELQPDGFHSCTLVVDKQREVNLQHVRANRCTLHAELNAKEPISGNPELLAKLLQGNLFWFWNDNQGITLGMDSESGRAFIAQKISIGELSVEDFIGKLEHFINTLEFWCDEISQSQQELPKENLRQYEIKV